MERVCLIDYGTFFPLVKKKNMFRQARTTVHGLNYSNKPIIQHVHQAMKLTYTRIVAIPSTIALEVDHALASEIKATSYISSMEIKAIIYSTCKKTERTC